MICGTTPALLIVSLLAILLAIANGPPLVLAQDVRTNYMPGTDFAKYKILPLGHNRSWLASESDR